MNLDPQRINHRAVCARRENLRTVEGKWRISRKKRLLNRRSFEIFSSAAPTLTHLVSSGGLAAFESVIQVSVSASSIMNQAIPTKILKFRMQPSKRIYSTSIITSEMIILELLSSGNVFILILLFCNGFWLFRHVVFLLDSRFISAFCLFSLHFIRLLGLIIFFYGLRQSFHIFFFVGGRIIGFRL